MMYQLTRIAPTPSGYLHIGNITSFALTAAMANKSGAGILLRIDDMDRERVRPEYLTNIFDSLRYLEIPWTKGPDSVASQEQHWSQKHRLYLYREALTQLKEERKVYACDCSRSFLNTNGICACTHKNLPLDGAGLAWRLYTDPAAAIRVTDINGATTTMQLPDNMHDFVVRKKDGMPSYQLSSLVDDCFFEVDLVVRGADLWPSTLAQLYLASVLRKESFLKTHFLHHPLLKHDSGEKLSKSAGDTSVLHLMDRGYSKAGIYHLIAQEWGIKKEVSDYQELANELMLLPGFDSSIPTAR